MTEMTRWRQIVTSYFFSNTVFCHHPIFFQPRCILSLPCHIFSAMCHFAIIAPYFFSHVAFCHHCAIFFQPRGILPSPRHIFSATWHFAITAYFFSHVAFCHHRTIFFQSSGILPSPRHFATWHFVINYHSVSAKWH